MKILVLLSGGLDSAVILASLVQEHDEHKCSAIGFDYGQRHLTELNYAEELAHRFGVPFLRCRIPPIPLIDDVVFAGRNLVLAAHAISQAHAHKLDAIALGSNATDWHRFPDCRPPFYRALDAAAESYGIGVLTPLLYHWKTDIVRKARELGILDTTWSCYAPTEHGKPCGKCLACVERDKAIAAAQ